VSRFRPRQGSDWCWANVNMLEWFRLQKNVANCWENGRLLASAEGFFSQDLEHNTLRNIPQVGHRRGLWYVLGHVVCLLYVHFLSYPASSCLRHRHYWRHCCSPLLLASWATVSVNETYKYLMKQLKQQQNMQSNINLISSDLRLQKR
jgi:hypothetical protein